MDVLIGLVLLGLVALGFAITIFVAVLVWYESRRLREQTDEIQKVLAVVETLAIDSEDFARRNRHLLANLSAGIEHLLEAIRPDLAAALRASVRKNHTLVPRALEEAEELQQGRGLDGS